ncbi:hypothetical protein HYW75_04065 [Candidatus Pacearchaeota archaeon]|nr:hypothetical protein [Candidatus Pacearchaeota archaeon]
MEENEKRIRAITKLYYSNPKIQEILVKFARNREVVPRYYEGFGKRPDILQYPSDVMGAVSKGATSFHCSEEIWNDVLRLNSDLTPEQMGTLRKSWDLIIDIDSRYFDLSKEAAKLVIEFLENYGIKNYGIKFSGSKGMHIIVSGKAFVNEYQEKFMNTSFPEWPRAITEFIFSEIKPEFRKRAGKIMSFSNLEKNDKEEVIRIYCIKCNTLASKGDLTKLKCLVCNLEIERKNVKNNNRRLRCLNKGCAGVLEIFDSKEFYYCEKCKDPLNEKFPLSSNKHPEMFQEIRGELAEEYSEFDLVLVAPRHLFRMPYSLHEKTSLASVVLNKEQIPKFSPKDADPLRIKIMDFMPQNFDGEAKKLLFAAIEWKKEQNKDEEENLKKKYNVSGRFEKSNFKDKDIDYRNIREEMYPQAIKELLKGLKDGKKRGLFILITFLRSLNYPIDFVNLRVREWNKLNEQPLKEGYIKSQITWHFKQKKKILPPNYENKNFYADLGLLNKIKPNVKNPIVEVLRALRKDQN